MNIKNLPLNELLVETDYITTPFRGYSLIDYLLNKTEYKNSLIEYISEVYDLNPHEYIFWIWNLYCTPSNISSFKSVFFDLDDFYRTLNKDYSKVLDKLSDIKKIRYQVGSTELYKLLNVRKYPFIKVKPNRYILADYTFLIEKSYNQLINDFWFDKLKDPNASYDANRGKFKVYRSTVGKFLESYLGEIIESSFGNRDGFILKKFDELKSTKRLKRANEFLDIYLRQSNRVLLGEVKAGSIYDLEKYGGSITALYKNDRDKFFDDLGVNQVIESIQELEESISEFDPDFPLGDTYELFPCIVMNDKAFQTFHWASIFNSRFQDLIKERGIDREKIKINPLRLMHINDFERLEYYLAKDPELIWEILKYNFDEIKYIYPFYITLNAKFPGREYPDRIKEFGINLIKKYSPNGKALS